MNRNRILKITTLTLALTNLIGLTPIKANAEWKVSGSGWYYTDSTENVVTGWQQIDGNWYYMWSDGTMAKNTWIENGDKWYYLGNSGAMVYNTVIDGYTIGNNGYWIVSSRGSFTEKDIIQKHYIRGELGQNQRDIDMSNLLSYTNIQFDDRYDKTLIEQIPLYIMEGKIYINEAKDMCIGKIYKNKYMITDIKFYEIKYKDQDVVEYAKNHPNAIYQISIKEDIVKNSILPEYKSNADYIYDRYGIFSSSANNSSEWEAMRVIVEFDEV
ncbi:hypothetical protein [Clostridium butyricum]|uniref:hypothetical protein n=1 Tax=Clostridium butyricum TaxID=1492 RepID=UPI0022E3D9A8|nr:hypothetical protein [Clostridium butyricum]